LEKAMLKEIPCIYRNGEFVPQIPVDFPEGAKVWITFCLDDVNSTEYKLDVANKLENTEKESAEENFGENE
jgi:predicted DNA-binding antitoxin AbrB/MazE fold protein